MEEIVWRKSSDESRNCRELGHPQSRVRLSRVEASAPKCQALFRSEAELRASTPRRDVATRMHEASLLATAAFSKFHFFVCRACATVGCCFNPRASQAGRQFEVNIADPNVGRRVMEGFWLVNSSRSGSKGVLMNFIPKSKLVPWAVGWRVIVSAVVFLGAFTRAQAQGVEVLTEETLSLVRFGVAGTPGPTSLFQVDFGFATGEAASPGQLHDSLTLILTGFLDGKERILVTLDVFGLTPKPLVEGAGDFSNTPIEFRNASLDPLAGFELPLKQSFTMSFPLPPDWLGQGELTGFLATNGDGFKSVGFVGQPTVVPEPGTLVLWCVGAGMLLGAGRRAGRVGR